MRSPGRPSRLVAVLVVTGTVLVSACSLVSGWADLQGGTPDGAAPDEKRSSGSSGSTGATGTGDSSGSSGTSGTSGTSGAPKQDASSNGYVCGSAPCAASPAEGCCVDLGAPKQCRSLAECETTGGFWVGCDRTSACSGLPAAAVCCWDLALHASRCKSTCGTTDIQICHPDEGDCNGNCSPGAGGVEDLFQCN